jgi:hypothetical protein
MPLNEVQKKTLFDALQEKGWRWREDVLYAPNEGFWLMKSQPWVEDLQDFHERMIARLERIKRNRDAYKAEADYKNVFNNTADSVEILQKMVDDKTSSG